MKKRIMSLILAGALLCSGTAFASAEVDGLAAFRPVNTYRSGMFTDVKDGMWYTGNVAMTYELDLMRGSGPATFAPGQNVTLGSAVALACRIHSIYHSGSAEFVQGTPWYRVYQDYAEKNGLLEPGRFADLNAPATRLEFASLLAGALPAETMEPINAVVDGGIPDLKRGRPGYEQIYLLYRAGVLTGSDEYGSFCPDTFIDRASVATVVSRMVRPDLRMDITLAEPSSPEKVAHAKALKVLRGMPYYGERSRCRMTAAQAEACARLIADGIAGQAPGASGRSWEQPYEVEGYSGPYRTDRNVALLGDFAGDGIPYLYLRSSQVGSGSFDIYGWKNGRMELVMTEESWGSRRECALVEKPDGTVAVVSSGPDSAAGRSGEEYSFRDGGKVLTNRWSEAFNRTTGLWEETVNGVTTTYTEKEWKSREPRPAAPAGTVYTPPDRQPAVSLRALLDGLNAYASAESGGTSLPVAVPRVTPVQKVAREMLKELDRDAGNRWPKYEGALLFDLNGDGLREMICSGRFFDGAVFYWKNGALQKAAVTDMNPAVISVVRYAPTGEYGLKCIVEIGGSVTTTFLTATHRLERYEFTVPEPPYERKTSFRRDDQRITGRQYQAAVKDWTTADALFDEQSIWDSSVPALSSPVGVRAELNRILAGT